MDKIEYIVFSRGETVPSHQLRALLDRMPPGNVIVIPNDDEIDMNCGCQIIISCPDKARECVLENVPDLFFLAASQGYLLSGELTLHYDGTNIIVTDSHGSKKIYDYVEDISL